jgi:hypothetical protein
LKNQHTVVVGVPIERVRFVMMLSSLHPWVLSSEGLEAGSEQYLTEGEVLQPPRVSVLPGVKVATIRNCQNKESVIRNIIRTANISISTPREGCNVDGGSLSFANSRSTFSFKIGNCSKSLS